MIVVFTCIKVSSLSECFCHLLNWRRGWDATKFKLANAVAQNIDEQTPYPDYDKYTRRGQLSKITPAVDQGEIIDDDIQLDTPNLPDRQEAVQIQNAWPRRNRRPPAYLHY